MPDLGSSIVALVFGVCAIFFGPRLLTAWQRWTLNSLKISPGLNPKNRKAMEERLWNEHRKSRWFILSIWLIRIFGLFTVAIGILSIVIIALHK
jgi:hypothetical protein